MKKSDLYGIIGSAISCGIILLLLFLILMPRIEKPEEEGIIVSFGDSFIGGGQNPVTNVTTPQQPVSEPTPTQSETPLQQQLPEEDIITQVDPSLEIARQEEERRRREQEEIERRRREEERRLAEQRRLEEQQAEARRLEEERQRQEAIDRANAAGNAFGLGANTSGSGIDEGDAQQGNPAGQGSSEGNSWSLDGRNIVGRLIIPTHDRNVEGTITVAITVDANGNVTDARIDRPTTIGDEATRRAALDAARRTKFTPGRGAATGTITYNFRLR